MISIVEQARGLLQNQSFEYAFCGGLAIDLFLGFESRMHGDLDVLAYWKDRDDIIKHMWSLGFDVFEMLGGGKAHHITDIKNQERKKRNIFCCKESCELVKFLETPEKDVYYVDFRHIGQQNLDYIEFLFNDKTDTDFLYAGNHDIKRNLKNAFLLCDGIPYLAPEICLLYKSTDTEREGYQHDYDMAMSKMNDEQKLWLNDALKTMYPRGHKWII